ncbi:signal peptidase I [Nonomuraea endophytica]|uniref:Signal peptidase I n=1 Tax=Nonomuraea endophytica TaxID=714136 RepID=A0A7W8A510_9ACTN|nr:signal peptidase I [Nonomuraea endophytica]MBB5079687.1 signal peptidase I [Nonomuraea endophytica]
MAVTKKAEPAEKKKKKGGFRETVLLLVLGVGIALLLQAFVVGSFYIPSESMENTLQINDRVFVNKLAGKPERGDIVVFKGWDGQDTIKRVIGVGGDKVVCCDSKRRVTVNGVALEEKSYLFPDDEPSGDDFKYTVPAGKLFLMGDHRSMSQDSRDHVKQEGAAGWISEEDVVGKAFLRYWPLGRGEIFQKPESFDKVK